MKLLNTFLNKVSKKDFKHMIKSVAALKLFASSMQDEDILRSLYVLSFNDIPNKDFSIKEAITRRADAKEKLNLVERQLIAKEVCTVLKNASALFDSELANITNNANNFIQPKNPEFIKSAKFGLLANVNGKYHLVNPLTNRVASEFIIEAADERYAKLHELVGQYRKENKISHFDESDGMMVLTGSPEVINDLEHKVKDIGYYCEAVNEETGAEGEIPEYSLKVFIDKVASSASKVSKISSFSKISELRDSKVDFPNPIEDKLYETKDVLVEFGAHSFDTPDTPLVKNEIGGFSDLVHVIEKKIDNSIVPVASQYVVYNDGGYGLSAIKYHTSGESISEDDMSRAISAINQDFGKRFSKFESDSNSKDLQIKDIDTTNPNLKKDNPMLNTEGAMGEVVEKPSAEKLSVEKKAVSDSFYTGYSSNRTMDELGYAADAFKQVCDEFGIPIENLNFFREAYPEYTDVYSYNPQLKHCTLKDGPVYDMCVRHLQGHIPDDSDVYFEFTPGTELFDVFVNGNLDQELSNLLNDNDAVLEDYYELMKELNSRLLSNVHWSTGTKLFDENGYYILAKKTTTIKKKAEEKIDFEKELMEAYSIVQKDYSYRAAEADKPVNASAKVTAKVDFNKLLQNKTFKDADDLENTINSFVAGGKVLKDDADGFTIEALEEDGKHTYKVYLLGNGGPSEEVRVEKVEELTEQEEKPAVEKKADIDFDAIKTAIQPYGWSIDEEGFLHNRKGNNTGAQVTFKKGRYQLRFSNSGRLIFSTGNPSDFAEAIEKLWYAQKIDTPSADNTEDNVESAKKEDGVEKKAEEKIDFEKELMEAGESKGKKDKVNKEQLEMGKKVEKEHTTNPEIAEKITRDHLAEFPDYYTHLKEMEDNAKKNNEVKSSYAPFITIDATTTDEVKVVAGEKVVGTCKTIQAAFEKTADWSSEELLIDDGTGVTVTYQVYDAESELPVVWAALRHRDNGNVIMCSDAVYVDDLLGAEEHIDFIKDIKDFSKEFAKVGLDEEKVQHYQDQTNAKLKEIFQSKPELGAQLSAKPEVKKEADVFNRGVERNNEEFSFDSLDSMLSFLEQHGKTIVKITIMQSSVTPEKYKVIGTFLTDEEIEQLEESNFDKEIESSKKENINKKADEELKQFDMKQELDGQKEFEKQDDFSQVSVPEEKEDTSEVNEAMSAKPTQNKGESFSASEFGNNLAYIKQNNPEDFESIMANLKQLMVGDQKPMYDFLELWSQNNFQNFTETTRVDPTYERHSQYQEQLKNNVLPKVMEMSEYKKAMEEKVSAEKGNVESAKEENIEKKAEKETKEEYIDSEGHTHTIITKVDKNREHPYIFEHLIDGQWASTSYNDFPVDLKEEIEHIKRVYPINPEGN